MVFHNSYTITFTFLPFTYVPTHLFNFILHGYMICVLQTKIAYMLVESTQQTINQHKTSGRHGHQFISYGEFCAWA